MPFAPKARWPIFVDPYTTPVDGNGVDMVRVRVRVEPLLARLCLQFLGLLHRRHAQALDGLWVARHAVGGIVEVFAWRERGKLRH